MKRPDRSRALEAEGPFALHCAITSTIWKLYMVQGKLFDDNLASAFNSDLDPLLIFGLQEDLQSVTNMLLMILIARQHNTSATQTPSFPLFQPTSTTQWVNGLWFSSLMFSLMSALWCEFSEGLGHPILVHRIWFKLGRC
ncbi:hypothetical protein DFH09DRAFT_211430 [Mycena vulgaris]|nr:hypothetical protein DFH09DRAFT_211430 [Mycena vulgaris]